MTLLYAKFANCNNVAGKHLTGPPQMALTPELGLALVDANSVVGTHVLLLARVSPRLAQPPREALRAKALERVPVEAAGPAVEARGRVARRLQAMRPDEVTPTHAIGPFGRLRGTTAPVEAEVLVAARGRRSRSRRGRGSRVVA